MELEGLWGLKESQNKTNYAKILRENLEKSAEALDMGSGMMFQYDNDLKHTAKSVKKMAERL